MGGCRILAGIYFSLSIEYFRHTNKKCISDSYVSSQKGQLKFSVYLLIPRIVMHHLNKHMDYRNICDSQKRRSKKEPSETDTWSVLSKTASATFKNKTKNNNKKPSLFHSWL